MEKTVARASDALLTAALPLRIQTQSRTSDLDRLERQLLPSFDRFWQQPDELGFLILRSPVLLDPEMVMMDVTPEILHRDTTLELLAEIGKRNGAAEAEEFLFENRHAGWTEYSLYWLFVLERQREDKLYCAAGPLYEMAWRPEHVASLACLDAGGENADSSGPLFFVLQSTLEISARRVERLAGGRRRSLPRSRSRGPSGRGSSDSSQGRGGGRAQRR